MTLLDEICGAALDLARAGRWERALTLLDVADSDDPRFALAAAEIAVDHDMRTGGNEAATRLATAERLCGPAWDVQFLRLRIDYFGQLFADGRFSFGPDGKDPAVLDALHQRAGKLAADAPDSVREGWAHMYHGLILDNLFADRAAAPAHYAIALRAGEGGGDVPLTWEALRHLGDHDRDEGHLDSARERWQRATALAAASGATPATLAQQMLLAVLARDTGDEAGAVALAREISRWSAAIGAVRQHQQAEAFLANEIVA
ncbi:hypothetical protein OWR29_24640 [Actinoplanes sp. Pm04-4]|uniref:Uncharacterized protein n=1 Tax=Paractinoplanes pyxinae TaxID=2997416 RepID=A0ABT4B3Z5_9ACTN|nr:hypothetical protein [Actinoplanes pyxinae]MCY1141200.1 hypothetical protein [Actinoplanes pyxinae]